MADNKNEYYTEAPIRLIQCLGNSLSGFTPYMVIIYEKDGLAGDLLIRLNGTYDHDKAPLSIPYVHFVDDESVVVWKTTVETGIFSGEKKKRELFEVRINRNFQSKI